jgi:ring-1,2-phenylacetyl-CoA epoxidase subunit PaaC
LHARWQERVNEVLTKATLHPPPALAFRSSGTRGVHSEFLSVLLAEMQSVARAHPGATW